MFGVTPIGLFYFILVFFSDGQAKLGPNKRGQCAKSDGCLLENKPRGNSAPGPADPTEMMSSSGANSLPSRAPGIRTTVVTLTK